MSALNQIISICRDEIYKPTQELQEAACAELALLREAAAERDQLSANYEIAHEMHLCYMNAYAEKDVECAELARTITQQATQVTALERQIEAARLLIDQSESDALVIVNMSDGWINEMAEHLANQLGEWLAANASAAPEATSAAAQDMGDAGHDWLISEADLKSFQRKPRKNGRPQAI